MRPNLPILLVASNAILKPGGLLRWKKRLVKDARLSLPLTEMIKIARLASPFFKRIVLSSLLFFPDSTSILSSRQVGFRSGRSTLIKFCTFFSPFRMGLTYPGRAFGRSSLLLIFPKLLTLSGFPLFSINSFRLAILLALLVGLNLSFLIGALAWCIKITKVVPFESVEVFRKDPFLALYFLLSSSMIFLLLCHLPSAALFTLTIWPFSPSPPRSPQGALV